MWKNELDVGKEILHAVCSMIRAFLCHIIPRSSSAILTKSFNIKLQGSQHCKNEIRGLIFHALNCVKVDKDPYLKMWRA